MTIQERLILFQLITIKTFCNTAYLPQASLIGGMRNGTSCCQPAQRPLQSGISSKTQHLKTTPERWETSAWAEFVIITACQAKSFSKNEYLLSNHFMCLAPKKILC